MDTIPTGDEGYIRATQKGEFSMTIEAGANRQLVDLMDFNNSKMLFLQEKNLITG